MKAPDPRIDAYIAGAAPFARPILTKLRRAFHQGCPGVVETIKWGSPAFEHGGLLGGMAAFKSHVAFSLWHGMHIEDPEGLFEEVGNRGMAWIKIARVKELPPQTVLRAYIGRAVEYGRAVRARPRAPAPKGGPGARRPAPPTPPALAAALAEDDAARATFESFPPSAQRDYIEWITEAKRETTRAKRLATTMVWLAEGKRRNWKYERR